MNYLKLIHLSGFLFIAISTSPAMATEEAKYSVISKDKKIEIRHYTPQVIAETIVNADIEEAGNIAFKRLFGYISGNNITQYRLSNDAWRVYYAGHNVTLYQCWRCIYG